MGHRFLGLGEVDRGEGGGVDDEVGPRGEGCGARRSGDREVELGAARQHDLVPATLGEALRELTVAAGDEDLHPALPSRAPL